MVAPGLLIVFVFNGIFSGIPDSFWINYWEGLVGYFVSLLLKAKYYATPYYYKGEQSKDWMLGFKDCNKICKSLKSGWTLLLLISGLRSWVAVKITTEIMLRRIVLDECQDYDLVPNTTHVVCFNFIRKWRDLQFKRRPWTTDFWETFTWQVYLLSEFLPEICWAEIAEEIFFFHISFWCLIWDLRLITQHTPY